MSTVLYYSTGVHYCFVRQTPIQQQNIAGNYSYGRWIDQDHRTSPKSKIIIIEIKTRNQRNTARSLSVSLLLVLLPSSSTSKVPFVFRHYLLNIFLVIPNTGFQSCKEIMFLTSWSRLATATVVVSFSMGFGHALDFQQPSSVKTRHHSTRPLKGSSQRLFSDDQSYQNNRNEAIWARRNWCLVAGAAFFGSRSALCFPYSAVAEDKSESSSKAPFRVKMEVALDSSTSGEIIIEVLPDWSPMAAQRFHELLEDNFFSNAKFFRVLPGYVAQFGIAAKPDLNKKWMFDKSLALQDEPRLQSNKKGTLSFASSGKNSRQTQIFINLANNDGPPNFLDVQGFVPFARVIKGMDDVIPKLYSGYGLMESASAGMAGSVNQ